MADKIKTTNQLKLVAAFTDGDDRTLALDNPKSGLTKADITAIDGSCLVGDKAGAAFDKWQSAEIVETENTKLDLTA